MVKIHNHLFLFLFLPLLVLIYNANISRLSILQSLDELLLAVSMVVILVEIFINLINKKLKIINLILIIYIVYQYVNYELSHFDLNIFLVLAQSLINIKVFLISYATLIIYINNKQNNYFIKKIMILFIVLFFIGIIINLILGSSWNLLFDQRVFFRNNFVRPIGYYISTAHVGYFFVLTFFTFFMLMSKEKVIKNIDFLKIFIFIIIDFLLALILSTRKGMFINIPFGAFVLSLFNKKQKLFILIFLGVFLSVFFYIIKDMQIVIDTQQNILDMNNPTTSYIRGLMIYNGINLFIEFFPFGVGNATFGTVLSQYNTFDVYQYVGLDLARIYHNNNLHGVYDSGFASMLAENGFIGMILMFLYIYIFKIYKKN